MRRAPIVDVSCGQGATPPAWDGPIIVLRDGMAADAHPQRASGAPAASFVMSRVLDPLLTAVSPVENRGDLRQVVYSARIPTSEEISLSTLRVRQEISLEETQHALSEALGPGYQVNSVAGPALKVKRNAALWATVHPSRSAGVTTFRVTSGGLIFGRAVNAVAVTRKVHSTLARAFPESAGARRER